MEFELEVKDYKIVLKGPQPQMFSFDGLGGKRAG